MRTEKNSDCNHLPIAHCSDCDFADKMLTEIVLSNAQGGTYEIRRRSIHKKVVSYRDPTGGFVEASIYKGHIKVPSKTILPGDNITEN